MSGPADIRYLDARALRPGRLRPPPSKSDAQRALVLAHALGRPELCAFSADDASLPDDVRVVAGALPRLSRPGAVEIDCGDGGAPFRFLLTQAALRSGEHTTFHGSRRLAERPHAPLLTSLQAALGANRLQLIPAEGSFWPLRVTGAQGTAEARFEISAQESSQYPSSLLLGAAALARREGRAWSVALTGEPASLGYLDLTLWWLEKGGFDVSRSGQDVTLRFAREVSSLPPVPGDWSSLGYLLVAAWRTGSAVEGVDPGAAHPDRAILRILGEVGLTVSTTPGGETKVTGVPTAGLSASGEECPDLLPTLAVLACALPAPSVLHAVHILRAKESDRVRGILDLVTAAGGRCTLEEDRLHIIPPTRISDRFEFDSQGDHRLAMCATTLAILARGSVKLERAQCVQKSFPGFYEVVATCGVQTTSSFDAQERARGDDVR